MEGLFQVNNLLIVLILLEVISQLPDYLGNKLRNAQSDFEPTTFSSCPKNGAAPFFLFKLFVKGAFREELSDHFVSFIRVLTRFWMDLLTFSAVCWPAK